MNYICSLRCAKCGSEYPDLTEQREPYCQKCINSHLEIVYDYDKLSNLITRKELERRPLGVWKYKEFLPIRNEAKIITLGEGGTGLLKANNLAKYLGINELYLKNETTNPTGSFKDRSTTVGITRAIEFGVEGVLCSTSGNDGSSLAAYAAKAGLKAYILTRSNSPLSKVAQMVSYGAKVVRITAWPSQISFEEINRVRNKMAKKHNLYMPTITLPSLFRGMTISFEIIEQLGWKTPNRVIYPGCAGVIDSWFGFKVFQRLKLMSGELPIMHGVEPEGADPVSKAFKEDQKEVKPLSEYRQTIAGGIDQCPFGFYPDPVLTMFKESKGSPVVVTDEEILEAVKLLASKEGIFAEPAGASSIAALKKLSEGKQVDRHESVACIITGSGLKYPSSILSELEDLPVIPPEIKEIEKASNL